MKNTLSRRDFARSGALVAAAFAAPSDILALAQERTSADQPPPFGLGLASYTFRNFTRAQVIAFMKQLPDGSFETNRVSVGRDGINPPMERRGHLGT